MNRSIVTQEKKEKSRGDLKHRRSGSKRGGERHYFILLKEKNQIGGNPHQKRKALKKVGKFCKKA